MKALRLPAHAFPVTYLFRFRAPRDSSVVRARFGSAPVSVEDRPGPGQLFSRLPACRRALAWTRTGSHRFPGYPSHASAPVQDPGRTGAPSPWRSHRYCPRPDQSEDSSDSNFEANSAALTSAAYASRTALPPSQQGSLPAGWLAFAGRESNPLDRDERFQNSMFILLSRAYPVARSVNTQDLPFVELFANTERSRTAANCRSYFRLSPSMMSATLPACSAEMGQYRQHLVADDPPRRVLGATRILFSLAR